MMTTRRNETKSRWLLTAIVPALFVLGFGTVQAEADDGWVDLFDGESFHGWRLRGGEADIYIDDEVIVNNAIMGTPGTCLCTEQIYDDFILTFEVKTVGVVNSGMNFRGRIMERDTEVEAVSGSLKKSTKTIKAGALWAYQAEVDPTDRAWTGGLYESGRRGWLVPS